jgi:hypothetical protein
MRGAPVKGHYMSAMPFLYGARYITCKVPGCARVKRNDLVWPPNEATDPQRTEGATMTEGWNGH